MSAFLGPIHHWLYHKVELQEELMADIQALATKEGWAIPAVEGLNPSGVLLPLESSIDLTNIHGWLQGQITAEARRLHEAIKRDLLRARQENQRLTGYRSSLRVSPVGGRFVDKAG